MACRMFVLYAVCMLLVGALAKSVPPPSNSTDGAVARKEYEGDSGEKDRDNFPVNQLPILTYRPKKYTVYTEGVKFAEAWQKCIHKRKRLASVESYSEHLLIRKAIAEFASEEASFWIAGTNLGATHSDRGKYYWITNDRPVGYLSGFENWMFGEPTKADNQCIGLYLPSAMWITGTCDTLSSYVCEEWPEKNSGEAHEE